MNGNDDNETIPTNEMIQTLKNLSKVEIDVIPSSGVLLYGLDGAEIRTESSKLIPHKNQIHRVYLRYGNYKIGWIIDQDVKKCLICNIHFGLLTRRHHCRNCGFVVCGNCSTHRAVIRQLKDELTSIFSRPESRVCDLCAAKHRLNEIWDAKPPPPTPSSPAPSSPPQAPREGTTVSNSEQSIIDIPETPTEQPTNPALNQYSDPVPLNLFPIMNEEKPADDAPPPPATAATATAAPEMTVELEAPMNSLRSPTEEQMSPSIHAFSIDDNEPDEVISDDEDSPRNKEEEDQSPPTQRPAARRSSWLEQKLGINIPGLSHEVEESPENDGEEEGEGGIDSDSEGDHGSSASGESVNSSRLSSRKSRSSRSIQSRSLRMNRTSDSYDESILSSDYLPSPLNSPASSYQVSSPQGFSSPREDHAPITVSQLKLHSEQQRLIQLDRERKAEKLRQQQEQERLAAAAAAAQTEVTPIKSRARDHELNDQGLSPPVSSASSSPAMPGDSSLSSSSPSPAKRRSSLMWFFGMRDRGAPELEAAAKPSPILRRGSDPGIIPAMRNSEEKRNSSLSRESVDPVVPPLTPVLTPPVGSERPPSSPPLLSSKSLPL